MQLARRACLLLRLAHDADEGRPGKRSIVMNGEVQRIVSALSGNILAVRLSGAMLYFSHHGHVRFATGPEIQHDHAAGIAVRALELSSTGRIDDARADQLDRNRSFLERLPVHRFLLCRFSA
jgi:hypothetical protein